MKYYHNNILKLPFQEAMDQTIEALKRHGFGIVSSIMMHDKFKEKLGVEFKKYAILGACNPTYAYNAIKIEEKIGTMLPCNVVIIEQEENLTEIAAIDPVASMLAVENPSLKKYAEDVDQLLKSIISDSNN